MHWDWGWWHMGGMWLFWLVVLAAVIAAVWLVARAGAGGGGIDRRGPGGSESPEQILKQRYARGEIDRDEYQRRLTDLRR